MTTTNLVCFAVGAVASALLTCVPWAYAWFRRLEAAEARAEAVVYGSAAASVSPTTVRAAATPDDGGATAPLPAPLEMLAAHGALRQVPRPPRINFAAYTDDLPVSTEHDDDGEDDYPHGRGPGGDTPPAEPEPKPAPQREPVAARQVGAITLEWTGVDRLIARVALVLTRWDHQPRHGVALAGGAR